MSFVEKITPSEAQTLKRHLVDGGFEFLEVPYALFCAQKPGIRCTAYTSGKLVAQGRDLDEFVEFILEPALGRFFTRKTFLERDIEQPNRQSTRPPHIGQDEAGKGDLFGPLCIAGVYIDRVAAARLGKLKIRDGKSIGDKPLQKMAAEIRSVCHSAITVLQPSRYNALYERFKNLNLLLAWSHAEIYRRLFEKTGCRAVLVDQFAQPEVLLKAFARLPIADRNLEQRVRAEDDLAVACASILARDAFLTWIETTSRGLQFQLPKGAGAIARKAAYQLLTSKGEMALKGLVKWHFKTIGEIQLEILSQESRNL